MGYGEQWGNYTDLETGLVLMTYRYYNPYEARFLTRDPMGYEGGLNLYAYTRNNPVNRMDPLGLDGDGFGGWIDHYLLGDSIEHWGNAQGRYDSGKASGAEVAFAALSGGFQTVLLAVNIVDGAAFVRGGAKLIGSKIAARQLSREVAEEGASAAARVVSKTPCFIAGTLVQAASQDRNGQWQICPTPIEAIQVGEYVVSRNEQTGETHFKPVLSLKQHTVEEVLTVRAFFKIR